MATTEPPTTGEPDQRDRLGLAILDEETCWARLAAEPVGCLALVVDGRPHLVPVNHVVRGRQVMFGSVAGTKLHEIAHHPGHHAAFEVDRYDPLERVGWSVVVHGTIHPVDDLVVQTRQDVRGRPTWLDGYRDVAWVALRPERVQGRELDRMETSREVAR